MILDIFGKQLLLDLDLIIDENCVESVHFGNFYQLGCETYFATLVKIFMLYGELNHMFLDLSFFFVQVVYGCILYALCSHWRLRHCYSMVLHCQRSLCLMKLCRFLLISCPGYV